MMADSGTWSLGTLIWLPCFVVLVVASYVLGRYCFRKSRPKVEGYSRDLDFVIAGFACWGIALLLIIGTVFTMYPYSLEYHQWRQVSGTVQQIDKRLIGNGDGMEEKFVVSFEEGDGQYGCDDTRCAAVREGDQLTLSCKRVWQYTGTDGYDCRFVSTGKS